MSVRKQRIAFLVLFLLLFGTTLRYQRTYPIALNDETTPEYLLEQYEKSLLFERGQAQITRLYPDGIRIGELAYYLIETAPDSELGDLALQRGLNGRYKCLHMGWGNSNFLEGIVEADSRKYAVFGGLDGAKQIGKITFSLNGQSYELHNEGCPDHFLLYTEVSPSTEERWIDMNTVHFYNTAGVDITDSYDTSVGGIG